MNILYVMQYFPVYGGGETITVSLANEFIKRGHNVYIAYTQDKFVDPMPYNVSTHIKKKKFDTLSMPFQDKDVNCLKEYIITNNIDIVINQWAEKKLCYAATRGTKAKLIRCYHVSTFFPLVPDGGLKKIISKYLPLLWNKHVFKKQLKNHIDNYRYCDKYVFLTEYAMEELYEKFKFDKNKVDYVYNPLTYSEYANINLIKQKRHQVLFVGRQIEYHKRMSYFLKAWKLLSCTHDISDWNLIILGEGPDEDLVRETIKKFNIPNCTPVGFHAPLDYYKESALLLLTSYIEGWGMVIPEGMQNGVVPIVTDSFSAAHAIIKDGHDGLIVENNNIPLYAESIWRLISNASLREQMAINAIESSKKFEISAIADKWLKIFNELKVN